MNSLIKFIENVVERKYTIEEECKAKAESNTGNSHLYLFELYSLFVGNENCSMLLDNL
jgi:hypothetical protein